MTQGSNEERTKEKTERDPVCGMNVDPNKAAAKVEHAGRSYYFCAPGCAKRFQQAPEKYLQPVLQSTKNMSAPSGLVSLHATPRPAGAAAAPAAKKKRPKASDLTVPEAGHHPTTHRV